jgi:hypothetical protein
VRSRFYFTSHAKQRGTVARPDIAFNTRKVARFYANLIDKYIYTVKRIYTYLKRTKDLELHYSSTNSEGLIGYVDSDLVRMSRHKTLNLRLGLHPRRKPNLLVFKTISNSSSLVL